MIPGHMPDDQETPAVFFGEDLTAGVNALPRSADIHDGLEHRFGLLLTQNEPRGWNIWGEESSARRNGRCICAGTQAWK